MKQKENWYSLFTRFFMKYFIIGLLLIIISVIYTNSIKPLIPSGFWLDFLNISDSILLIIGPSLLVASFFTFSIESRSFIEYIKDNLERVIIRKEFLDKLSTIDKKDALQRILRPNEDQFKSFANIKNYFDETINKAMNLFDSNFKTHFNIDLTAKINSEKKLLYLEECLIYRLYKSKNGYNEIQFGFEREDSEPIEGEYILPEGKSYIIKKEDFNKEEKKEESGFTWNLFKFSIPAEISSDYITVRIMAVEYGYDHWQEFTLKYIIPSDGVHIVLNTNDPLIIKDYMIFDNEKYYSCHLNTDKTKIQINTSQWISPGSGCRILVASK